MHRRQFFRIAAAGGAFLTLPSLLAACGGDEEAGEPTPGAGETPGTAGPRSTRELRVAANVFPVSLDPDVGFASFSLMGVGALETLMRVTPDMKIEPWLAEEVTRVDSRTWRVLLREGPTFWDGSPVDAAAVQASFERTLAAQPGAISFAIPQGTTFSADGRELLITTPTPIGALPANLSVNYLGVKKVAADGSFLMTGPYIPTDYVELQSVTLKAYDQYHGGVPRTPTIRMSRVPDVSSRVLALQAGDVDMAFAVLPSQVAQLKASGLKVESFLFGRLDGIILNNTRAPLDDLAVRQAMAFGIDREELVEGVLDGEGSPAYGLATADWGIEAAVETQRYDLAAARKALDDGGWVPGSDGVRSKNGQRLSFTLTFYKSRPELEPFSIVIQDRLAELGFDIRLEETVDINRTVAENAFDAIMYSYTVAPSGDLNRGISQLFLPGSSNNNRYRNPEVERVFVQYNQVSDTAARNELARRLQELIGADVPFVYLAFPNQLVAMSSNVEGYKPHLLENYQIDGDLYIKA